MKIGLLTPDLSHNNGWAHYSLSLIQALHSKNIQTTVISATNSPQTPVEQYRLLPTVTPPGRFSLARMLAALPQIRRLFADCDLIHATAEPYAPLLLALNKPSLITIHGSYAHLPRIRRFPVNTLFRRAYQQSTLVCVSNYTAQVVSEIIAGAKTVVINNAIDATRFATIQPQKSPEIAHPLVITAGGVKARKGTLPLVQAIATVRETIPGVCCHVIGNTDAEPAYTEKVRSEITRLNLQDCVKLMGFVDEQTLLDEYGSADLFVMPALNSGWKFEGFGLTYLEASAAGLPVIGTIECGAADAIEHGVTGLLLSQKSLAEDLPDAIVDLLSQPDKAVQMGLAGRERAQRFTWDRVADEILTVYDKSLSK